MRSDPLPTRPNHRQATGGQAITLRMILAIGVLATSGTAQFPVPEPAQVHPRPAQKPEREEHSYQGGYSKSRSHELFRACDANSDDRLNILETADAFDVLLSPKDHQGFARFDTDRDGFVTWPEFDQRFRKGLEYGGTFRIRTSRPFALPDPPPQALTPLQKFIRLYDRDGDGGLSPDEITNLLKQTGLPVDLAGPLLQSDLNKSGTIDEPELAPWFQMLQLPAPAATGPTPAGLRQPWLDADANLSKAIESFELDVLLRRLDPSLLRWSKNLIAKLDSDRDGKLSAPELEALEETPPEGKAGKKPSPTNKPAAKPAQAPQR